MGNDRVRPGCCSRGATWRKMGGCGEGEEAPLGDTWRVVGGRSG